MLVYFHLCLHASKTFFVKDVHKDDEKRRKSCSNTTQGTFSYENVICLENIQLKRQYNNETKTDKMTYVYKVEQLFLSKINM